MKKLSLGSVLPIILIVACIGGGYFFSYGQWVSYSQSQDALKAAQAKLDAVKKAQGDIDGFLAKYRDSLDSQPMVDRALPPNDMKVPEVLALLEQLALNSGLGVDSINNKTDGSQKVKDPNSVQTVDFDVQVNGTYEEFQNFLLLIEQNLRISDLQDVTFQKDENTNTKFSLVIRMYYQK